MDLKEAFETYMLQNPANSSGMRRILLSLQREGLRTTQELSWCYYHNPDELINLRNIGPKSMDRIKLIVDHIGANT